MARLTGQALLDYVKSQNGADRDQIIEGAGYVVTRNGKTSLQRVKFFEEFSKAQGFELSSTPTTERARFGPVASYRLKVGARGLVPVSNAYCSQIGLKPGDYVTVAIEDGAIVLYPDEKNGSGEAEAPAARPSEMPVVTAATPMVPFEAESAMNAMVAA